MSNIDNNLIDQLKSNIDGTVVLPQDSNYDDVRSIWNAMIDRKPAVIVQCASAADASKAFTFARENGIEFSIRGAGHNIAGSSLNDGGLLIDFSNMTNVRVDADKKRAYVQPGATLGDFDAAVQAHGLATPVGINSTTGIAGLTLGGGFGWLTRKYGMTIDNLISVDVITADGKNVKASESENADLFWAIRGGGGNFGIATQFEYKLYSVGPEVLAGLIVFPLSQAKQVLDQYRKFTESTPDDFNAWVVMRHAPPLPFLPEEVHGTEVIVLAVFHSGHIQDGQKIAEALSGFGDPHGVHVGPMPYADWQQAFDPLLTPGARNYWKTHNFTDLSDGAMDKMIEYAGKMPSPQCEIFIALVDGAPNQVAPDAMAYGHRDVKFVLNVHGRWDNASDDESCISWARDFFKASAPFASTGAYVNFMTDEEGDRVAAAYGSNYDRLVELKKKYDPENVFHFNQNIKP